ncbi:MAG: cob(I)yrinic acid a,c-diamide adenosyltransferase [Lautropia sp.]
MANRLTRIATRTGDDGSTGLGDGSRVGKDAARIGAIGDVDELNATLGMLAASLATGHAAASGAPAAASDPAAAPDLVAALVAEVQHDLFALGAELSIPGFEKLPAGRVAALDAALERHNADLPPLAEFILPGGSEAAARAHVARTVCRRAERSVVALAAAEPVRPLCQQYLNRLSDLLFILARQLNRRAGVGDIGWRNDAAAR